MSEADRALVQPVRRYLAGAAQIAAALQSDEPVRVLLIERDDDAPEIRALRESAQARGVEIWAGSSGDLRRMSRGEPPERAIAMLGADPHADVEQLLARNGAVWLLHGAAYPSNVGFTIRTAEVSGAQGVIIASELNHDQRSRAAHVSMGAHRMLPVLYTAAEPVIARAKAAGYRIVALEDVGTHAPHEVDLCGSVVLLVGGERDGLPEPLLAQCDAVLRIPMAGFVPSYSLQAAVSAIASERLRQLSARYSNH